MFLASSDRDNSYRNMDAHTEEYETD
jgi:hypothetical protein